MFKSLCIQSVHEWRYFSIIYHTHTCTHTRARTHTRMHTHTHTHACIHTHTHTYTHTHKGRQHIGITKVKYKCYCLSISINYHITYIPFIHTEWNENLEGIDHEPMVIVDEIHGPNANGEKYMKRLYELILNTRNDKWFKLNLTTDQTEAYKIDHLPQAKMYRHNFHTFITYFLNFKYFCHFYHFCDF